MSWYPGKHLRRLRERVKEREKKGQGQGLPPNFLSWEKLSEEDVEILKQIYRDAVTLNSKVFKLQGHFPLGNTYFLVLDNLLGAIRGLSDPESIKRNPTYIKEKINGAKYYLERLIKESEV